MASLLIATASATLNRISCCLHFVGSLRVFRSCPHMFFFFLVLATSIYEMLFLTSGMQTMLLFGTC